MKVREPDPAVTALEKLHIEQQATIEKLMYLVLVLASHVPVLSKVENTVVEQLAKQYRQIRDGA